jgi:hypothetical protein
MVGKSINADRASMVRNHGSQGTWLEFDRVISADRASSSNPLRAVTRCSSLDGSQGTWLEFDRVIIADRASDVHTPSFSCHRCAHTKLFLPSMCTQPGQQQQSPAGCDSMQFPRWSANRSSPSRFA